MAIKSIELLKKCASVFEEMDAISWNDDSSWQASSYEETAADVYSFLNNIESKNIESKNKKKISKRKPLKESTGNLAAFAKVAEEVVGKR